VPVGGGVYVPVPGSPKLPVPILDRISDTAEPPAPVLANCGGGSNPTALNGMLIGLAAIVPIQGEVAAVGPAVVVGAAVLYTVLGLPLLGLPTLFWAVDRSNFIGMFENGKAHDMASQMLKDLQARFDRVAKNPIRKVQK